MTTRVFPARRSPPLRRSSVLTSVLDFGVHMGFSSSLACVMTLLRQPQQDPRAFTLS